MPVKLLRSGRKLLPTDSLFFQMNSAKTYRYRCRSVIISNLISFTDTYSYSPFRAPSPKITDMQFLRINYGKLTDTDTDL